MLDHVADHHLLDLRAFLEVALRRLEPDEFGRAVVSQREGPGPCAVRREPHVAEVAVRFVRHHGDFVDDGGGPRGQHVHHEVRREVACVLDRHGVAVGRDHFADVLGRPAELGEDEGGVEVQLHHPLEGEDHVLAAHGVPGMEGRVAELEGDRLVGRVDLPAFGEARGEHGRVLGLVLDKPVVDVRQKLAGRELVGLRRVERDDVVYVLRDDQHVVGRGRVQGR